jgi:hypothetical protein
MMDLRHLANGQRIKRRLSLFVQRSYTHPDGHIELNFEEPAGINREDDEETQEQKLLAYDREKAARNEKIYFLSIGLICGAVLIRYWPHLWPF